MMIQADVFFFQTFIGHPKKTLETTSTRSNPRRSGGRRKRKVKKQCQVRGFRGDAQKSQVVEVVRSRRSESGGFWFMKMFVVMWCHSLPYWTCDSCEPFIFPIISYILGGPTDTMAIICSFVYMCEVTVFGPTFVPGGGNQKQQQAMISWSRLKKNHLSFSRLERCMEIFSSFQWGLKMTHHFNLKGQTSFHQAVKDNTWDFVTVQWAYRQPSSSLAYEWHWQSALCAFYRWCGIPSKTSGAVVPRLHPHLFATEKTGKHRGRSQFALIGGNILYFGGRNLIGKSFWMLCSTFVVYSKNWSISLPSFFFCRTVLHVFAMDLVNCIGKVFGKRPPEWCQCIFKAGSISSNEKIAETVKLCDFRHSSSQAALPTLWEMSAVHPPSVINSW